MSKRFRKLSHTLYECKYHLIFCPKYRHRILKDEIGEYTRREIVNLLRQKDGIEIIGNECAGRACAFSDVDAAEVCGIRGDGIFKREIGNPLVSAI